ncbi:hypothetical protein KA005_51815 [bacterium]|nr:hypothetical protein [bacterium]
MSNILELKGVVTKEQLLDQIKDIEAAKPLEVKLGKGVNFHIGEDGKGSINHKNGPTTLSSAALGTLLAHIGFPRPYLRKIPIEQVNKLVVPHLNFWYGKELAGQMLRLLTIKNNAVAAIPKANFKHVPISEILSAVDEVLGKSVIGYHKVWPGTKAFQFSILTPETAVIKSGQKNDVFNAGIRISHSIDGQKSTTVSPYLFRQWCSNGATTEHQLGSWKRRSGKEDIGPWLQRTIIDSKKVFGQSIDTLQKLCGIKIDKNTSEVLDSVLEQSMVPRQLQKVVRNTLIDDGADSLYDVYNILTKVDTHSSIFEEHPNAKGILNNVASNLACHSKLCPVCHKQMQ